MMCFTLAPSLKLNSPSPCRERFPKKVTCVLDWTSHSRLLTLVFRETETSGERLHVNLTSRRCQQQVIQQKQS